MMCRMKCENALVVLCSLMLRATVFRVKLRIQYLLFFFFLL